MAEPVLKISGLSKRYGKIQAVSDLSLEIEKGSVFGMLGPNGSGKTTTLAMILGVVNPTAGSYSWFGEGDSPELRKRVGSILEHPIFYPSMSARKNLEIVCHIKDVDTKRIEEVIDIVGLKDRENDAFRTYSLGMKQRLAIGAALLSDPEVLIFDEPTNGLDPQGIAQIRALIKDIAKMGKTIILASHLLDEVQKICSHFCVLRFGKLIYSGNVEQDFADSNRILLGSDNQDSLLAALEKKAEINHIKTTEGKVEITVPSEMGTGDINKYLVENNIVLNHLSIVNKSLEEQFLEILKDYD